MKKNKLIKITALILVLLSVIICSGCSNDKLNMIMSGKHYEVIEPANLDHYNFNLNFIKEKYPEYYKNTENNLKELKEMYEGIIDATNKHRYYFIEDGLTLNPDLCIIASIRAEEIAESGLHTHQRPYDRGYFSKVHKEYKWDKGKVGENIAWGYKTVDEVITAWKNSAEHNNNIINTKWTCIGVGIAKQKDGTYVFVQEFAEKNLAL